MNKEEIDFLISLREELKNQETDCQANPRFWVVKQTVKDYWVDDNIDGICVYSNEEGESVFEEEGFEELPQWLNTLEDIEDAIYQCSWIELKFKGKEKTLYDIRDVANLLDKISEGEYNVCYYRLRSEIVPNTMFLTKRECKEHIECNKHHYNSTVHTYAMTACRSPQVNMLLKILEKTKWEELKQ